MFIRNACAIIVAAASLLAGTAPAAAPGRSGEAVKVTARMGSADAKGRQAITITLDVHPDYQFFANVIGNEDFAQADATAIHVTGRGKLEMVQVEYPPGDVVRNTLIGDYRVYKGKVVIRAAVRRAKGNAGPVEVVVTFRASSARGCCGRPSSVKVIVP